MDTKLVLPVVLDGSNYLVWSRITRTTLKGHGWWSTHVEAQGRVVDGEKVPNHHGEAKWLSDDRVVVESLRGSLKEAICAVSSSWRTAQELWDGLKSMFSVCSLLNRRVEIKKELGCLQEGESLSSRLEVKKRVLLAELADVEALSQSSVYNQLVDVLVQVNESFVKPLYVFRRDLASWDVHMVDTKKDEVVLVIKYESLGEELAGSTNQEGNSCIEEADHEGSQLKEVVDQEESQLEFSMDQEKYPRFEEPLMSCSWEESDGEDWGIDDGDWYLNTTYQNDQEIIKEDMDEVAVRKDYEESQDLFKEDGGNKSIKKRDKEENDTNIVSLEVKDTLYPPGRDDEWGALRELSPEVENKEAEIELLGQLFAGHPLENCWSQDQQLEPREMDDHTK